jgi:hypothetical protein
MSWENIIKTEYVWLLYEDGYDGFEQLTGVFKSKEAAEKYIVTIHQQDTPSRTLTAEDIENIYASYGYFMEKKELKG